jgi:hypothetical protein
MTTRDELLDHLWREVIDGYLRDDALDNIIANCNRFPDSAFAETGPIIERLLAAGVSRCDLRLLLRATATRRPSARSMRSAIPPSMTTTYSRCTSRF